MTPATRGAANEAMAGPVQVLERVRKTGSMKQNPNGVGAGTYEFSGGSNDGFYRPAPSEREEALQGRLRGPLENGVLIFCFLLMTG